MSVGNDFPLAPAPFESSTDGNEKTAAQRDSQELSQRIAALIDEREAISEELKTVKGKYRRATTDAQTAKHQLASLSDQLAEAQARLAAIEGRSFAGLLKRVARTGLAARLKPKRSPKARRAEEVDLVRKSHLFDANWYLATYPDIAEAKLDPALHYVRDGWSEGRDPGPEFSSSRYLKANRDVAQSGLNPLVHYLEHGLAEGRSAGGGRSAIPRLSVEDFGPAMPVYRSPIANPEPIRWLRQYQLDPTRPHLSIGEWACGYYPPEGVPSVEATLARFYRVSGLADDRTLAADKTATASDGHAMVDGWFAGQSLFRARWDLNGGPAQVVRGFQRGRDGAIQFLGEALVTGALDVLDFHLAHPLLPILFLTCRPDGECIGATTLFFPSLCRGGLNYGELLLEGAGSPVELGERYAQGLEAILAGEAPALVRTVRVDLAGADGTRPLFQSDAHDWLNWVMRVDIGEAIVPAGSKRAERHFLSDCASGAASHSLDRSASTGQLILPSDSMPTIAILVATAGEGGKREASAVKTLSMVVVNADPAKSALSIAVPDGLALPTALSASAFPLAFARIEGAEPPDAAIVGAIRTVAERALADSELLLPLARTLPIFTPLVAARAAVVAIEPALWSLPALEAGLAALDLQLGSDAMTICTIGVVDPERRTLVERAFHGRTLGRVNVHAFVEALGDADIVHVGPGVILHDARTLVTLQSLLVTASSASCPILRCSKHGKNWAVSVADAGQVFGSQVDHEARGLARHSELLWRSIVPVGSQPANLWATRPAVLRNAPEEASSSHLLCTWLTASYFEADKSEMRATLNLPAARADLSMRVEELFG